MCLYNRVVCLQAEKKYSIYKPYFANIGQLGQVLSHKCQSKITISKNAYHDHQFIDYIYHMYYNHLYQINGTGPQPSFSWNCWFAQTQFC